MTVHTPDPADASAVAPVSVYDRLVAEDESAEAARQLLAAAVAQNATDIHLHPRQAADGQASIVADLRVMGSLTRHDTFTPHVGLALMRRFQHACSAPADRGVVEGICDITIPTDDAPAGVPYRLYLARMPVHGGHQMVLRLQPHQQLRTLASVFPPSDSDIADRIRAALDGPRGLILVAGPTLAGKSTTLAAALHHVARPERKVVSVEDPVESYIPGVQQVPVTPSLQFPDALSALMRCAADVIMVSEICDQPTAEAVVDATQIGHTLLAAVAATRAPIAVTRLINMGVTARHLIEELRLVVAQRLVRRLCDVCSTDGEPRGCAACNDTGYAGRVALAETLVVDDGIALALETGTQQEWLSKHDNYRSFEEHAAALIANKVTTPAEVKRALGVVVPAELINRGADVAGGTGRS